MKLFLFLVKRLTIVIVTKRVLETINLTFVPKLDIQGQFWAIRTFPIFLPPKFDTMITKSVTTKTLKCSKRISKTSNRIQTYCDVY